VNASEGLGGKYLACTVAIEKSNNKRKFSLLFQI